MIVVTPVIWQRIKRGEPFGVRDGGVSDGRQARTIPAPTNPRPPLRLGSRNAELEAQYRAGETLATIGAKYGITRERVRQILAKRGVTRMDGGQTMTLFRQTGARAAAQREAEDTRGRRILESTGMSLPEWREYIVQYGSKMTKGAPWWRYQEQRGSASTRGVEWAITFKEWWTLWQDSGHWAERGRGHGYCMARYGDSGPYALNNVYITTCAQNFSDSYLVNTAAERRIKREATQEKNGTLPCVRYAERNAAAREMYMAGVPTQEIAAKLGMSNHHNVYNICKGLRRKRAKRRILLRN